jgi:hypothetical protein
MLSFTAALRDRDIADTSSYIRTELGNRYVWSLRYARLICQTRACDQMT